MRDRDEKVLKVLLAADPQPMNVIDITKSAKITRASYYVSIDRLEVAGLITTSFNETTKREQHVLTDLGRERARA